MNAKVSKGLRIAALVIGAGATGYFGKDIPGALKDLVKIRAVVKEPAGTNVHLVNQIKGDLGLGGKAPSDSSAKTNSAASAPSARKNKPSTP